MKTGRRPARVEIEYSKGAGWDEVFLLPLAKRVGKGQEEFLFVIRPIRGLDKRWS
jgi:hypothetical protein